MSSLNKLFPFYLITLQSKNVSRLIVIVLFGTTLLSLGAFAFAMDVDSLTGPAYVIDGDTIKLKNKRIRLHGIDAPERKQWCLKNSKKYRCGEKATGALKEKIGVAEINCKEMNTDRYKRIIAICRIGTLNLNKWMVRKGWALAYLKYSRDYEYDEKVARNTKAGLWGGNFVKPWHWRRGIRLNNKKRETRDESLCKIKGNIGRGKKLIYHLPNGKYYALTKIDEMKGERWFCSEKEATEAGWRKSQR
tara:strand:+ start:3424 stop:4167 length:744 start_codon:yes stop_codon:yes gene_type:complete